MSAMSTLGSIYNATAGPLVIDGYGRTIGGGERRDGVNLESVRIADHIEAGRLIGTPAPVKTKAKPVPAATTDQEG